MKMFLSIIGVLLLLVSPGCGSDESSSTRQGSATSAPVQAFATITYPQDKFGFKIVPSDRPPPKVLLVRDLERGEGRVARHGDRVAVYYKGVNYRSGKLQVHAWPPARPLIVRRLGYEGWGEGWEEGIEGMRESGRRELVIPQRLTEQGDALDYVVELVRVWP
jgi:hypothetical protein